MLQFITSKDTYNSLICSINKAKRKKNGQEYLMYCNFKLMDSQNNNSHQDEVFEEDYNSEDIIEKSLAHNISEVKSIADNQLSSKNESPAKIDLQAQQNMPASVRNMSNDTVDLDTDITQFKLYGPAIYLFFVFIKKAIILFSVLAALNLILIFYNFAVGQTFPVKAKGIPIAFARASLGSFSSGNPEQSRTKLLYSVIVSFNIIAFFCFWLYWRAYSSRQAQKIQRRLQLSNFCTVVVEGKGVQRATEKDIEDFMMQFGIVKEVVRVPHRGEEISLASSIVTLEQQIDQITNNNQQVQNIPTKQSQKLISKYESIQRLRETLKKQVTKNRLNQNIRYFVKLDSRLNQKKAISKLRKQKCCLFEEPSAYTLREEQVKVRVCEAQCWGIFWQNQHVGFKHNIIPNIILVILVNIIPMAIIMVIGLVSAAAEPVYYEPLLPTNDYSQAQILASANATTIASWCIGNHYSPNLQPTCSPIMQSLNQRVAIYFAISFCMALSQYFMKITILWFSKYFRFKDHAQRSNTIVLHLIMNYTVIYVVIPLAVQANLFETAMSDLMAQFITIEPIHSRLAHLRQYYDYVPQWYADYGFQLVLNYFILILLPYSVLPLSHFIIKKIKLMVRYSRSGSSKKEVDYQQVEQFELEDHFANLFMSIIVGMGFGGGIPLMFPLILLSLIVKYFSMKYLFIYTSKLPKLTDRFIVAKIPQILLIAIFLYVVNTIWALGVQQIFTPKNRLFSSIGITQNSNAHTISQVFLVFVRRIFNNWSILFVFCLGLVLVALRRRLSNTWLRILLILRLESRSNDNEENNMQMHDIEDELELDKSYDPLNNKLYRAIFEQLKT